VPDQEKRTWWRKGGTVFVVLENGPRAQGRVGPRETSKDGFVARHLTGSSQGLMTRHSGPSSFASFASSLC
jgi:hypothetical protein